MSRITRLSRRIEYRLLEWTEDVPLGSCDPRLLGLGDDGFCLVPAERVNGQPTWNGQWCWYKPSHWPPYVRSRLARDCVHIEPLPRDA